MLQVTYSQGFSIVYSSQAVNFVSYTGELGGSEEEP